MSRTQRCIICTNEGRENPLFEDEVCQACGRCIEHCTAPHVLVFDSGARGADNRPHRDAGKVLELEDFTPAKEDPDRARTPV